jgi:hypothetical protein
MGRLMASLDRVEAELAQRIIGMKAEASREGLTLVITQGFRTKLEQWALWNRMQAAKAQYGTRWQQHAALAAFPGSSDHGEKSGHPEATAVDLACNAPSAINIRHHGALAARWGLKRTIASEYWHLQLDPNRGPMPTGQSPSQEDDVPQPFTLMAPSGRGRWTLFPNGDVHTTNFDDKNPIPFHGAMGDYPQERKPGRVFTNMQMKSPPPGQAPSDSDGYWIFSSDKGAFGFKKT